MLRILPRELGNHPCRIAGYDRVVRNLEIHDGCRPDDGAVPDLGTPEEHCAGTDPRVRTDPNIRPAATPGRKMAVRLAPRCGRGVVGYYDLMCDERVIADRDVAIGRNNSAHNGAVIADLHLPFWAKVEESPVVYS